MGQYLHFIPGKGKKFPGFNREKDVEIMTLCQKFNKEIFFISGGMLLFAGTLIYFCDRPHTVYFMRCLPFEFRTLFEGEKVFGAMGGCLPAFFHVSAFSLLSAGVLDVSEKKYILIVFFWTGVNILFELGQKFKALSVWLLSFADLNESWSVFLKSGPVNGTYDSKDIFAALAGGIAAWLLIHWVLKSNDSHACPTAPHRSLAPACERISGGSAFESGEPK